MLSIVPLPAALLRLLSFYFALAFTRSYTLLLPIPFLLHLAYFFLFVLFFALLCYLSPRRITPIVGAVISSIPALR